MRTGRRERAGALNARNGRRRSPDPVPMPHPGGPAPNQPAAPDVTESLHDAEVAELADALA